MVEAGVESSFSQASKSIIFINEPSTFMPWVFRETLHISSLDDHEWGGSTREYGSLVLFLSSTDDLWSPRHLATPYPQHNSQRLLSVVKCVKAFYGGGLCHSNLPIRVLSSGQYILNLEHSSCHGATDWTTRSHSMQHTLQMVPLWKKE